MKANSRKLIKAVSIVVLVFFSWTFGGGFEVAYAVKDGGQESGGGGQQRQTKITPPGLPLPQVEGKRPEEKFQKTIEDIEKTLGDAATDIDTKKAKLKNNKTEIESLDIEIRKQFKETEEKINDLPELIKQRHRDFVKKYDDSLTTLKSNLDDIDKAKTDTEREQAHNKTKEFLAKTKPPKKHQALDPNKLPHRIEEPVWKEPRTKPEQFTEGKALRAKGIVPRNILVASNGPLTGLNSTPPRSPLLAKEGMGEVANSTQLALAYPPTNDDLAETIEVQFTPAIVAKAAELGKNPVKIYNWVRNNIEYVPTYGSIQGADMCLQTKQCNDFDTASLLIALLRVSGIHAKYVYGTIELPIEKVKNWVGGFTDSNAALTFMASGGIPVKGLTSGGNIVSVQMEHMWVEMWGDMIPSQGAIHKQGDTWIPLDASFKQYIYKNGMDIYSTLSFNSEQFLNSYIKDSQDITPYQSYGQQMNTWLDTNMPDATNEQIFGADDLSQAKTIVEQSFPVLLGTLPYKVVIKGSIYSQVPDNLRQKVSFEISGDMFGDGGVRISKSMPETNGKRLTLSYAPAAPTDEALVASYGGDMLMVPPYLLYVKPVIKIEGVEVATGGGINMGSIQDFMITIVRSDNRNDVIQNNVVAGTYSAISIQPQKTPVEFVAGRMQKLRENSKNVSAVTLDDLLGELLYDLGLSYFHHLTFENDLYAKTFQMVYSKKISEAITTLGLNISYMYGVPYSISQGGFNIDVDRDVSIPVSLTGDIARTKQFMMISGMTASAWEHRIFETFFDTPSVSAMKLLQLASQQGVSIYTIDGSNMNQLLPGLQVSADVTNDIQNAVNAGKKVIISQRGLQYNEWAGVGYIVLNPLTGAGAYMISGGLAGGGTTKVLTKPPITLDRNSMQYFYLKNAFIDIVIGNAVSLRDTKYHGGGNDPKSGFDCSGFTHYVYKLAGYEIPTRSGTCSDEKRGGGACNQYEYFKNNGMLFQEPQVGDLFYWKNSDGAIFHTGIVGGVTGSFITIIDSFTRDEHNNPVNKVTVRIFDMESDNYWINRIASPGFGRPID